MKLEERMSQVNMGKANMHTVQDLKTDPDNPLHFNYSKRSLKSESFFQSKVLHGVARVKNHKPTTATEW